MNNLFLLKIIVYKLSVRLILNKLNKYDALKFQII